MKGKAYANRKPVGVRSPNDFYKTPKCMVWELLRAEDNGVPLFYHGINKAILDPCCGDGAITDVLIKEGYAVVGRDIINGQDFLATDYSKEHFDTIIQNPPFSLFDDCVIKAKSIADKVYSIGKLNFFAAHSRNVNGLWDHLEWVLPFDRQIAFDKPWREDGKVSCGMLCSAWFIWDKKYTGYPKIKILDMQKYILKKGEE